MLLQFAFLSSGNESLVVGRQMCFCFTDDALFPLGAPFSHVVIFCARINAVYIAEKEEAGPGISGVEWVFVNVVSTSRANGFVAANDESLKSDKLLFLRVLVV